MLKKHSAVARAAAMVMALCLLMCTSAMAEGEAAYASLQPIMDLTASAALRVGEVPDTITSEGALSEAFVFNFFLLGQQMGAQLGITPDMLGDPTAQEAYLGKVFAATIPPLTGILSLSEAYDYIGVRLMAADENDGALRIIGDLYEAVGPLEGMTEEQYAQVRWLDKRAVLEFRKDDTAMNGWRLCGFSVDAELDMEDAASAYFTEIMVEYVNTEKGFSLQYPAVFDEQLLTEDDSGVSAKLADGSASFFARREKNDGAATLQALMDAKKQEMPTAEPNINEISGTGKLTYQNEAGQTVTDIYVVTSQWIYHAQLAYAPSLAKDFSLYGDYMTNSFTVDELGIG